MTIVASRDLKGLGDTDGAPTVFHWTPASPLPRLAPWLAMLALLMLPRNRTARAIWIFLPLLCVFAATFLLQLLIPSEMLNVGTALGFGIAAIWLLAPWLQARHRVIAALKTFPTIAVFALGTFALQQEWTDVQGQEIAGLIILVIAAAVITVALYVAGAQCRHRFTPARFLGWLILWLFVGTVLVTTPIALTALVSVGWEVWLPLAVFVLTATGIFFALLLPFLVLAFAHSWHRERLRACLQWADDHMLDSASVLSIKSKESLTV